MPKPKDPPKKPQEMTTEEAVDGLFPKKVRKVVERAAKKSDDQAEARERKAREKAGEDSDS